MKVKTWVEFTRVDERATRFAGGLMTDRALYPDAAVIVNQERVAHLDLDPVVPPSVRHHLDAARSAYCYAVFAYELYAVAAAQASLAEEFALAERYLSLLDRPIRLRNRESGETAERVPTRYGEVRDWLRPEGAHPTRAGWVVDWPRLSHVGLLPCCVGLGKRGCSARGSTDDGRPQAR